MEPNNSTFWQRYATMIKMVVVTILVLVLLIPSFMVREMIRERKYNQQEVVNEVGAKWGRSQVISGPVISIPYVLNTNRTDATIQYAHYLPESFHVEGSLDTRYRYRNIFKVIGYRGNLIIRGKLSRPDLAIFGAQVRHGMDPAAAIIQFPVSDLKGIRERVFIRIGNKQYELNPGLTVQDIMSSGLWCRLPLDEVFANGNTADYEIRLPALDGTQRISFLPLGRETTVHLKTNWPSPSFDGNFLPERRKISKSGFDASWKVLNINRNFPQQFCNSNSEVAPSEFGVSLIQSVDHYLQSERSAKYAILFISLTFLTFFFSEVTNNRKIHPIQYILVGLALVLFFSLLLSLSEQIGFGKAYAVSSAAIILMISIYARSILKNNRLTAIIGGVLTMLYGFIYIILQLENMALLVGSIGLFVILGLVMYISRNIDWYNSTRSYGSR